MYRRLRDAIHNTAFLVKSCTSHILPVYIVQTLFSLMLLGQFL